MTALLALSALTSVGTQQPIKFETIVSDRPGYYSTSVSVPVITGSPLGEYATVKIKGLAASALAKWMAESTNALESEPTRPYSYQATPVISVATPHVVSMYFKVFTDTGGAHPMSVSVPYTFAMLDGQPKQIGARDLFRKGYDVVAGMSSLVIGKLMQNNRATWVQNGEITSMTPDQVNRFVVTKTAITFLFDPYDVGPYVSGAFQVKVPFSEIKHDLDANGPLRYFLQ